MGRAPGAGDPTRRLALDQRQRARLKVWDHARAAARAVDDVAELAAEQVGFAYRDGRDITGFVDGTANPPVRRGAGRRAGAGRACRAPAGAT